ncbi:c-type cytochrome [Plesiomonas sp.]|uniref:c-type cytochrome n=1 Tax=Plesiomonas sp. TaxID=2486279 RepID=UPI003F409F0C
MKTRITQSVKTLAVLIISFSSVIWAADMSHDAISERIKPVGGVYLEDKAAITKPAGPRTGEQVYNGACVACHGSGALGAPKFRDAALWGPRLKQGIETLEKHAISGLNQMPPRGTCADCSDDEIKAAIQYMTQGL